MRRFVLLALPLAIAACSPPADETDAAGNVVAEEPAEQDAEAMLDLEASGLVVPAQNGFERLDVPFGSNRAATEATLANILGEPTGTYEGDGDCAYPSTQYDGMTLVYEDDAFVGYVARAPYVPELTREEMLEDSIVELIEESTLGAEFVIGDPEGQAISGLFTGDEDSATVDALWAGTNCIFR